MSTLISQQASFSSHSTLSDGSPFRSGMSDPDLLPSQNRAQRRPLHEDKQTRGQDDSKSDGNISLSGVEMGSLSSTIEERPQPELGAMTNSYSRSNQQLTREDATTATDDASHLDPGTTLRLHSSSSSSNSSYSSDSSGDAIEVRNRRFPPVLPSRNQPPTLFAAPKFLPLLPTLASRIPLADLSAGESTSTANDSSSGDEGEDSDGQQGDDDDNEQDSDEDSNVEERHQHSHVQTLWMKLRNQRDLVQQLRLELSSKRKLLRELRRRKNEADNRFMGMLRPYLVAGNGRPSPGDVIIRQFESMQQENDEYHVEETEVEQLEADLEEEELSRETLETQFFTILYGASGGSGHRETSPTRSDVESHRPPSRASLLGIPAERPVDIHPFYKQLLDAVGDRELTKEHHTELMMHRDSILYDLQLTIKRARLRDYDGRPDKLGALPDSDDLGLLAAIADNPSRLDELQPRYRSSIGQEDEEFLREFPKEEAMLREKLKEAKDEVYRLRQVCIEKGVMRKNAPYEEEYAISPDTGEPFSGETETISITEPPIREEALASTRFPILLSNPRHVLESEPLTPRGALRAATRLPNDDQNRPHLVAEAMKEYGISTLVIEAAADNKSDYINRWLLHRLRTSPLEVEHLYSVFSAKLKVKNTRRWQEDVLYFWSRDGANKPKEDYIGPVTTRDALVIDDDIPSEHLNSALGSSIRPESDPGDSPDPPRGAQQRPRSLRSAS